MEALAVKVDSTDGVYVVPAFVGLGAPYWNPHARGVMVGLTRGTNTSHIARAAVESIAYQTMDVLNAMEADCGMNIKELRVDGGASKNNLLMQFQADMLHTKVVRPMVTETTALGAAYLAGLAAGFWKNIEALQEQWQVDQIFSPGRSEAETNILKNGWDAAVKASLIIA